jgi:mitochondrial cardiolipin hydrolase
MINPTEIDSILSDTLADFRVSRSEKGSLKAIASEITDPEETAYVLHRAFALARNEISDPQAASTIAWLEDIVKIFRQEVEPINSVSSEALFAPADNCSMRIQSLIQTARQAIDICVFTITDNQITGALIDAHRRKIKLRIISDNDKSNDRGSDIAALLERGVKIVLDRSEYHMHHKYALFDRSRLLTGSYNWTLGASKFNEENFLITDDSRLLNQYQSHFDNLWKRLAGNF